MLKFTILFSLSALFTLSSFFTDKNMGINPTGTYEYDHGERGNGTIKVNKISADKIVLSIFVIGGPPSHNMGEFMETLTLTNGVATYKSEECGLKFVFSNTAVTVTQSGEDCGFGNGITANGTFKKTSSEVPDMEVMY
ncbi:MAG: hypothetical protein RLZZ531_1209 [Bacteroidota bacterium]|jgi:hypothetical protein